MHITGDLLKYKCAKNYQNIAWLDKVIDSHGIFTL